jgi:hypothetical protein
LLVLNHVYLSAGYKKESVGCNLPRFCKKTRKQVVQRKLVDSNRVQQSPPAPIELSAFEDAGLELGSKGRWKEEVRKAKVSTRWPLQSRHK